MSWPGRAGATPFSGAFADQHLTHHIEGTRFDAGSVSLVYLSSDVDTALGTWEMVSVFVQLPVSSMDRAYEGARARTPTGPLPLSPKRAMYGIAAAESEQDLIEEQALLDVNSQAAAMLGGGPDLFSLDTRSASHIHTNHINNDPDIGEPGSRAPRTEIRASHSGESRRGCRTRLGWGTLTPVIDEQTGLPFKNTKGTHAGRNQYIPVFHPLIAQLAGQMAARLSSQVKDDPTLGADVTALNPKVTDPPNPALAGAMWARHDGSSSVDQTPGTVQAGDSAVMVLTQQGPQNGLEVEPTVTGTGQPHVSVELENWYVRFLGVYLQFLAPDGKTVLQLARHPRVRRGDDHRRPRQDG